MIQSRLPRWPDRDQVPPLEHGMVPRQVPSRVHEQNVPGIVFLSLDDFAYPYIRMEDRIDG